MDWQAFWLSVRLSLLTSLILLVIGLPLAWWLSTTRFRWKFLIEAVVALPLILPPTVLGFYILTAISPQGTLGVVWQNLFGGTLPFTFHGVLIASVLYSLPFAVQPFAAAFAGVDRNIIESAWCEGAGRLRTFLQITLPLAAPGVVAGIVLSFAHTLGEFGVVMMVGGNLPGQTRTISIAIYDNVQAMDYAAASQTALILLGVSFAILIGVYGMQRKIGIWNR
ncbi:MAG: molybdate ABC transporter permease subunit [Chlorobi bacterium]|nr:MAG: phosphate ABC transporter permease [Chlorobi bacterium OLB7]MBK8910837.1 molybdate ABC transporter permease subunit [Chlorobiota bacterium]MBX7216103.1 molybdate ABC transporter permease subunit [Candidatus Kapabacteria bacterium]